MRLLRTGLCLALLLLLAAPARVEAGGKDDGWWGWIERLSGIGPFRVAWDQTAKMALEFDRLVCGGKNGVGSAFSPGNAGKLFASAPDLDAATKEPRPRACGAFDKPRWFISLNVSPMTNDDVEADPQSWGPTDLTRSLLMFYVRPWKTPVLHFGAGAGVYYFNGVGNGDRADQRYSTYQAVVPVRARVTPFASFKPDSRVLRNLTRSFYWEGGLDFMPGPIDARQFNSDADYHTKNEWMWTHRFVVNLTTLIGF